MAGVPGQWRIWMKITIWQISGLLFDSPARAKFHKLAGLWNGIGSIAKFCPACSPSNHILINFNKIFFNDELVNWNKKMR
jgi:hypothetical protein